MWGRREEEEEGTRGRNARVEGWDEGKKDRGERGEGESGTVEGKKGRLG